MLVLELEKNQIVAASAGGIKVEFTQPVDQDQLRAVLEEANVSYVCGAIKYQNPKEQELELDIERGAVVLITKSHVLEIKCSTVMFQKVLERANEE